MTKSSDSVALAGGIRKVDPGPGWFSFRSGGSGPTIGPVCVGCAHSTCRTGRAQALPRLGGHRSEYAREHAQAAAIQASNPHAVIWWGEATQSFWAAVDGDLHEAEDVDALLLAVWPGPDPAAGTGRTPEAVFEPAPGREREHEFEPWRVRERLTGAVSMPGHEGGDQPVPGFGHAHQPVSRTGRCVGISPRPNSCPNPSL
ncbi:hypothetical protein DFP74_6559 [Nocardiopsis sp. Huas11]|nr:hypothetical protein DFP74_6559 [Nocardiopsis sp. Huas11]